MSDERVEIKVGQVWRRKKDGVLIKIVRQESIFDTRRRGFRPIDDFVWQHYPQPKRGAGSRCYGYYIRDKYELVEDVA